VSGSAKIFRMTLQYEPPVYKACYDLLLEGFRFTKLSGVTLMGSMPRITGNCAKSGKSDGPWPQMPPPSGGPVRLAVSNSSFSIAFSAEFRSS